MLVLLCENFLYSYQAAGFAGGSSLRAALRPVLGASKANCGMVVLQKNHSHDGYGFRMCRPKGDQNSGSASPWTREVYGSPLARDWPGEGSISACRGLARGGAGRLRFCRLSDAASCGFLAGSHGQNRPWSEP